MKDRLLHKVGNPELAAAMRDKRKSNAATPHLPKHTKRKRTRGDKLRNILKEERDN